MLHAVTRVKPAGFNDSLLLGHNSLVTARIPNLQLFLSSPGHDSPFLKVVFVGGGGGRFLLCFGLSLSPSKGD